MSGMEPVSVEGAEGTESSQIDFSIPVGQQQESQQLADTASGVNPAWNEVMGIIPKPFHEQIIPHFRQWDQNVQQALAKAREEAAKPYQPYEQFVKERVNPQELLAAQQLFALINNSPLEVYQRLGASLRQNGLLQEEVQQQQEQQQAELEGQFQDPRFEALAKQQQELVARQQAWFEQQQEQQRQTQQQEIVQEYARQGEVQINAELKTIADAVNNGQPLPGWLSKELIERASYMTDREQRPVSLVEAYKELQALQSNIVQQKVRPPRVVPAGGGFPQQPYDPEQVKTPEGRAAAVKAIAERLSQS